MHCRKHLGDNATILHGNFLPAPIDKMVKEEVTDAGGPSHIYNFYGWEAERIVVVTSGDNIMELITRARTHLSVILVEGMLYSNTGEYFQQAADLGLVELGLKAQQ